MGFLNQKFEILGIIMITIICWVTEWNFSSDTEHDLGFS